MRILRTSEVALLGLHAENWFFGSGEGDGPPSRFEILTSSEEAPRYARETEYLVYVEKTTRNVFVIFPGSKSLADWVANFNVNFQRVPTGEGLIAEGLFQEYVGFWYPLFQFLRKYARGMGVAPFYLGAGGHSRGGALAELFGFTARHHQWTGAYRFAQLTKLGSPMVGDEAWSKAYRENMVDVLSESFVYGVDIVPSLPPSSLGYYPTYRSMWLRKRDKCINDYAPKARKKMLRRLVGAGVIDHSLRRYYNELCYHEL